MFSNYFFKCKGKLLNNKLHDRDVCLVGATALSRKPEIFFLLLALLFVPWNNKIKA